MWIGNHSWTHPHLINLSQSRILSELQQTQTALTQITGTTPTACSGPRYGETERDSPLGGAATGPRPKSSGTSTRRSGTVPAPPQIMQAASTLQNGQIILMHDQYATTVAAVSQIAANLRSRNMSAQHDLAVDGRAVNADSTVPPTNQPTVSRPRRRRRPRPPLRPLLRPGRRAAVPAPPLTPWSTGGRVSSRAG